MLIGQTLNIAWQKPCISRVHVLSYSNSDFKCMYLWNQIINLECVRHVDVNLFQGLHVTNAFLLSENLKHIHAHLNQQYTVLFLMIVPKVMHFKRGRVRRAKK